MVGSLASTHVGWKNCCPKEWQGSNTGKSEKWPLSWKPWLTTTCGFGITLCWPGSLNDINIWNRSYLLKAFQDGTFAGDVYFEYTIGDENVFNRLWILVNSIYLDFSRFVKSCRDQLEGECLGLLLARICTEGCWASLWSPSTWIPRARWKNWALMVRKQHCKCREVLSVSSQHDGCISNGTRRRRIRGILRLAWGDDTEDGLAHEAEQVYVDQRDAEMQLHYQLYETNDQQDHRMTDCERQILESLRFQYVQPRWACLYDLHQEHLRLRDSIVNHIEK